MASSKLGKVALCAVAGLSFLTISTGALAKNDGGTKPGWGYGDKNHVHSGPPPQSVVPIEDIGEIVQSNHSVNSVSLNVSSNTGGNSANNNSSGIIAIVTGAASTVVSFVSSPVKPASYAKMFKRNRSIFNNFSFLSQFLRIVCYHK